MYESIIAVVNLLIYQFNGCTEIVVAGVSIHDFIDYQCIDTST